MNLKLQYVKFVLVVLALLACFCFNAYAQSSTTIGNDTVVATIKDENGNSVSLYLPESMNNDQCERRIYGTRTGVIGMFKTLYSEERRTESYEAAIRELCMQPGASQSYIGHLEKSLQSAGIASEDANFVLDLVKHGANSINKKYFPGGTDVADLHNRIAKVGRDLNAAQKSPAFAMACIAFENVKATAKLTETITGAFLLNSLSTDQAWIRLKEIERAVNSESKAGWKVDPALEDAIEQSEINLLAAQSDIGAFAVSVNDNLQEITDSAINLGATLAKMSFKFSAPVAMWVGAPLMTYNTLRGISDQWEMAQDAVSLATVTKMVEKHSQGREDITDNITSYGQYAFYSQMEETFSVGGAKFHDFINIFGSANKDLSQYYKQRKQNTMVIEMGSDESPTPSTYSEDFINIISVNSDSRLVDGVDTDFTVVVEYNLFTYNQGILLIGFNNGESINSFRIVNNADFLVNKGPGTHEFNVTVIPKDWGSQGDFLVYVNISEYPHPSTWKPLDSDRSALTFY
jgi:hypothetical protein